LICGVYKVFVATVAYVIFDSKGGQRSFTAPGMNWQSADMDETALAVLARVSVVADKLKRGDFAN
jgi:hypothetical protein